MPAVTLAQCRFLDLEGKPIKEEEGRIYIFTAASNQDAHKSFTPWNMEAQTTKEAKFVRIIDGNKFKPAASVVLNRTDPKGWWCHLAVYSDKPLSADYATKYWAELKKRATLISDGTKSVGALVKADAKGDWIVKLDTAGLPFGPKKKCEVVALALHDKEGKSLERRPNAQGKLQVVPKPGTTMTFDLLGNQAHEADEAMDMVKDWRDTKKDFRKWAKNKNTAMKSKATKASNKLKRKGEVWGEKEWSLELGLSLYGSKEIYPAFECVLGEECPKHAKKAWTLAATGGSLPVKSPVDFKKPLELKAGELFDFKKLWPGAPPTTYVLQGKGCSGADKQLTVEVFPSTQLLLSLKLKRELLDLKFDKVSKFFKTMNEKGNSKGVTGKGFGFELEGEIKYLAGWRERENDWRCVFAHVIGAEFAATMALGSFTFSAVQYGLGIPQAISDYLADIRVGIGAEGKLSLGGEVGFECAERPFGHIEGWDGKVELKLTISVPLSLKAFVGKEGAIGASFTAEMKPGIYGKGEVTRSAGGQVAAELSAGLEACKCEAKVQLDYWVSSSTIPCGELELWDEKSFGTIGPFILAE